MIALVLLLAVSCTYDPDYSSLVGEVDPSPGEWVQIEPGTFLMGSPAGELGRYEHEIQHEVTLTRAFLIASTEVTQGEFQGAMGYNPSRFSELGGFDCGLDCPVEQVTWHEAAAYANELSGREELERCYDCSGLGIEIRCEPSSAFQTPYECPGYRLPTEAEWEYAARAGTTTATYNGDLTQDATACELSSTLEEIAWYCGNNQGLHTNPVAELEPNDWGLFDMLGNVWEWTHDWFDHTPTGPTVDPAGPTSGDGRARRGGSWSRHALFERAASRQWDPPEHSSDNLGFRLVRTVN